ncbi:MAG TPA: hypothetical protein VE953_04080 [Terriglobales bacterium]|nr:hypothetical protein [Terriglobales bacterium]
MPWQDRLANWLDAQLQRLPGVDRWSERHFHAIGLHGPEVRHLLKTRFFPAATVVGAVLVVLIVAALIRRRSTDAKT